MILYLQSWLKEYISVLNVFSYITFRTLMTVLTAFFISIFYYPRFINFLKRLKAEQCIRADGPKSHQSKVGTPTMGGLIIILSVLVNIFLWTDFLFNSYIILMTFMIFSFGLLGFVDDYLNVTKKNRTRGLRPRDKILLQILFATIFMTVLYLKSDYSTELLVPILKNATVDIGLWYIPFGVLVIIGTSNAVNLTDGMDGLAIVPSTLSIIFLGLIVYLIGHINLADYLHLFYIKEAGELAIIAGAIVGSALAFLWYNTYPAQIFMGDTGSLTLGAIIGSLAIITKTEILSIVFNGLFVIEALSVIIQVGSYKLRNKRIFRMAPLHHHFEVKGDTAEPKLVVRFWIVSILLIIFSIAMIKVR